MADLTKDTPRRTRQRRYNNGHVLTNAVTVYAGSFIGLVRSTGRATKWADTAGLEFLGYAERGAVGDTSASPPVEVEVNEEGQVLEGVTVTGGSAITDNGDFVYAADDGLLTLTPTVNVGPIGKVLRWRTSTNCDVRLFTPEEYQALGTPVVLTFHQKLAKLANGDIVTTITPGFAGRIVKWYAIVTDPATTGSKLATLNIEIGTTDLTGGTLALTSANMTPLGAVVAGAAITAGNYFGAADTLSIEAASVTAFVEGEIDIHIVVEAFKR